LSAAIEVINEKRYALDPVQLVAAAEAVLQQESVLDAALTIVITDNEEMSALNRQFRGIDAPTDVLSFPADIPALEDAPVYLGDLVIAYPYTAAQAEREGHDLMASLSLLVIHGTLHLLAYDHDTPAAQARMWSAQARLLESLNLPLTLVPDAHHD
jgi:probable rRNA maturation factor